MFKARYIIALMTFSMAGIMAQADPIDPVMSMDDPTAGTPVTLGFGFSSNVNGGGFLSFNNASGVLWTVFDVFVTLPVNSVITCSGGGFFDSCTYTSKSEGASLSQYDIHFSNVALADYSGVIEPQQGTGVIPGAFFTVNLNDFVNSVQPTDPNGSGGWGPNNSFSAVANNAPEPASWALLVAGGALVFGLRRRAWNRK